MNHSFYYWVYFLGSSLCQREDYYFGADGYVIEVLRIMPGLKNNIFSQGRRTVLRFYLDGFRSMTVGKTLWKIILIKLFVMFAILKLVFFSDYLHTNFSTDQQRSDHVLEQITLQSKIHGGEGQK